MWIANDTSTFAACISALAETSDRPAEEIEPRVAASVAHLGLVARLIAPSVAAAATRCGLGMRLGEVWWQDTLGGAIPLSVPFPGAAASDPIPVADLLEEVIAPLTAATSHVVTVSPQVLWGNVAPAASKAAALIAARRPELSRPAWTAAAALFATAWLSRERQPPDRTSAGPAAASSIGPPRAGPQRVQ